MTTPSERVEEIRRALIKSSYPQGWWYMAAHDLLAHLDTLTERLREAEEDRRDILKERQQFLLETYALKEALASAHAIRCTCDGATRDARCVELQGVA